MVKQSYTYKSLSLVVIAKTSTWNYMQVEVLTIWINTRLFVNIIRNKMKASNKLESLTIWIKFQLPKVKGRHDMFIMDILQTMKSQSTKLSLSVGSWEGHKGTSHFTYEFLTLFDSYINSFSPYIKKHFMHMLKVFHHNLHLSSSSPLAH